MNNTLLYISYTCLIATLLDSCDVAMQFRDHIGVDCASRYRMSDEQETAYNQNWNKTDFSYKKGQYKLTPRTMPWTYQDSSELDGYATTGTVLKIT